MSEVVGEGILKIVVDESGVDFNRLGTDAAKGGTDAGGKFSKGFLGSMKGLAVAAGGVFAAAGVASFLKDSIAGAQESAKIAATTAQIIESTGKAAGVSAAQVGELSESLSRATGIDDELIQSGQNLILTFKNVKNAGSGTDAIFNRATSAALDLSKAGFGSVESASLQLGKALNDPVKGIAALSRSGVTFTAAQKEQIKALTESGKTLEAQKIILKEVEGQVGGVAEATATNADRAKVAWGNVQETIGGALLPVVEKLAGFFVDSMVPAIDSLIGSAGKLAPVFSAVGDAISGVFSSGEGAGFVSELVAQFESLAPVLLGIASDLGGAILPVIESLGDAAADVFPAIAEYIGTVASAAGQLGGFLAANLVPVFTDVANIVATQVIPAVAEVATFLYGTLLPAIIQIATEVGAKLAPIFKTLAETFRTQILPAVSEVVTIFRTQLLPALQPIIMKVVQVVGVFARFAATVLSKVLPPIIRLAGFLIANVLPAVARVIVVIVRLISTAGSLAGAIGRAVGSVVRFAVNMQLTVARAVGQVVSAIAGLPGKVLGFVGKMLSAGKDLIGALFRGIVSAAKNAGGFVGDLASKIMQAAKDAINDALNLPLEISFKKGPINISATLIPRFADGTLSAPGGLSLVGERGPELVDLPAGARVYTAQQSAGMMRRNSGDGIDYAALAAAIAAALAPFLRPINVQTPATDPEAVAMQVVNRLVSAAG